MINDKLSDYAIIKVVNRAASPLAPGYWVDTIRYNYVDKHLGFEETKFRGEAALLPVGLARVISADLNDHFPLYNFVVEQFM